MDIKKNAEITETIVNILKELDTHSRGVVLRHVRDYLDDISYRERISKNTASDPYSPESPLEALVGGHRF